MFNPKDHDKTDKNFLKKVLTEEKLSAEERENVTDDDFGYIDEKGERHYPLNDEARVRSAISLFKHCPLNYKRQLARKIKEKAKKYNIEITDNAEMSKYTEDQVMDLLQTPGDTGSSKVGPGFTTTQSTLPFTPSLEGFVDVLEDFSTPDEDEYEAFVKNENENPYLTETDQNRVTRESPLANWIKDNKFDLIEPKPTFFDLKRSWDNYEKLPLEDKKKVDEECLEACNKTPKERYLEMSNKFSVQGDYKPKFKLEMSSHSVHEGFDMKDLGNKIMNKESLRFLNENADVRAKNIFKMLFEEYTFLNEKSSLNIKYFNPITNESCVDLVFKTKNENNYIVRGEFKKQNNYITFRLNKNDLFLYKTESNKVNINDYKNVLGIINNFEGMLNEQNYLSSPKVDLGTLFQTVNSSFIRINPDTKPDSTVFEFTELDFNEKQYFENSFKDFVRLVDFKKDFAGNYYIVNKFDQKMRSAPYKTRELITVNDVKGFAN
jgi:hypothetical protein